MVERLVPILIFTGIIHLTATLGYSVRLAGVRTQRLAIAFSLWNVTSLVSSTANTIQAPLLGSVLDESYKLLQHGTAGIFAAVESELRSVIVAATVGTVLGTLLLPSFVRLFIKGIFLFERVRSVPRMIGMVFRPKMLKAMAANVSLPKIKTAKRVIRSKGVPRRIVVLNTFVTGIWTIGVLAALYAGFLDHEHVRTTTTMSGIINGVATLLGVLLIDPHVASITDEAARGIRSDEDVQSLSMYLAFSRIAGTILAQALFVPAADFIVFIARLLEG